MMLYLDSIIETTGRRDTTRSRVQIDAHGAGRQVNKKTTQPRSKKLEL